MTSALSIAHLLEDGRELGADGGLECATEGGPDGSGGVRQSTSHGSARAMRAVMAGEVRGVDTRAGCGRRLVTARGRRRTIHA